MEVRLKDVIDSMDAMDRLFSGHARAKEGFKLALVRRKIVPMLEMYREARRELLQTHGTRDGLDLDRYHFWREQTPAELEAQAARKADTEAVDAFTEEHDDLLNAEVEVDYGVSIAQIDKAKIEPPLTPDELALLWWLIEDFRTPAE